MSILQPKHTKLSSKDADKILREFNVSLVQLPKISKDDPMVPKDCVKGDILRIDRGGDIAETYYRVVI